MAKAAMAAVVVMYVPLLRMALIPGSYEILRQAIIKQARLPGFLGGTPVVAQYGGMQRAGSAPDTGQFGAIGMASHIAACGQDGSVT